MGTRTSAPQAGTAAGSGTADQQSALGTNVVQLVGRLSADPEERVLPSGDVLVVWRLVVPRPEGERGVDTIDCAAARPGVRRSALAWVAGDVVSVEGCLRRRFWRGVAGPSSRSEVHVSAARRVQRAA